MLDSVVSLQSSHRRKGKSSWRATAGIKNRWKVSWFLPSVSSRRCLVRLFWVLSFCRIYTSLLLCITNVAIAANSCSFLIRPIWELIVPHDCSHLWIRVVVFDPSVDCVEVGEPLAEFVNTLVWFSVVREILQVVVQSLDLNSVACFKGGSQQKSRKT